jgi:phosphoribosylaminoimidazolecarboxamide formyltransferase/IMP cyclohydrolase
MKRRALISVSDKTGLVSFARKLVSLGYELISTGGTMRCIFEAEIPVLAVSQVTRFPEAFGGRVKTLHPLIHGGILYRRDEPSDLEERDRLGVEPIDLVVVNLYPFQETIAKPDVVLAEAVEQIDIGGPTLIRSAAKNFEHVAVVVNSSDYQNIADELEAGEGELSLKTRRELSVRAFSHTAMYDTAISKYLYENMCEGGQEGGEPMIQLTHPSVLRYGENPHQAAILYAANDRPVMGGARSLQGKALSYNNLIDADAAVQAVAEFTQPAAVVLKHTNPCGVGVDDTSIELAFERALWGDPQSAFGGIIALNRMCDLATAEKISKRFFEVVIAPDFSKEARERLAEKKNLRLLEIEPKAAVENTGNSFRWTVFGVLEQSQSPIIHEKDADEWEVVSTFQPTPGLWEALGFLWRVTKHVKSNAIVVGNRYQSSGVGAGQMSRVDAVEIALEKHALKEVTPEFGLCLASDAFFPFRDSIDRAAKAGVEAIIQPGGSRRDSEVIEAANEHGIAMVVTGRRQFKH